MRSKEKLEKLNPVKFTYELHSMDNSYERWEKAIGYCDSKDNSVLSKVNMMCVMFEDMEDERELFWLHIPYSLFNNHFETIEKIPEEANQSIEDYKKEFERINWEHLREKSKADFLTKHGLVDMFEKNIEESKNNADGLEYYVRVKGDNSGWWSYNKEKAEIDPTNVQVVNEVGGFHYKDFTKKPRIFSHKEKGPNFGNDPFDAKNIYVDSEYEFAVVNSRDELGDK